MSLSFWDRVRTAGANECWLWTGAVTANGYGSIWENGVARTASRVAYELAVGPIPPGLSVLHHCDVPLCMNPAHLYAGTHQQNMRDRGERKRARGAVGTRNIKAKLSDELVVRIRASAKTSELARQLGVHRTTIQRARAGKIWRHVCR